MPENIGEELAAWVDEIVSEHEYNQPNQVDALCKAIDDKPVWMLSLLVGEKAIWSLLNNYLQDRQNVPQS